MYNSDILVDSRGNFIYAKKTNEDKTEIADLQLKTDKNTNIIALMNRYNQLKYMADLSILDANLAINNLYIEAQTLGLDIAEMEIKIENGIVIFNLEIQGRD